MIITTIISLIKIHQLDHHDHHDPPDVARDLKLVDRSQLSVKLFHLLPGWRQVQTGDGGNAGDDDDNAADGDFFFLGPDHDASMSIPNPCWTSKHKSHSDRSQILHNQTLTK